LPCIAVVSGWAFLVGQADLLGKHV
jgi:hypothetical protein